MCLKFVNYAFFFWLPFYLHNNFGWDESEANQLSAWYDFGGIIGSVVGGIISVTYFSVMLYLFNFFRIVLAIEVRSLQQC